MLGVVAVTSEKENKKNTRKTLKFRIFFFIISFPNFKKGNGVTYLLFLVF
ncbi:hypothetical protein BMS3Abin05_01996 [bacterium BMS3Abin05]|nr:hypothetical protein BMS3Abin05_01996 [bacterium BMS3Abin05]GBE28334.1 hypothetical protein BMS3Bbin03_02273 [bacterium BMS3Bbin03]